MALEDAVRVIRSGGQLSIALLCGANECRVGGYKRQSTTFAPTGAGADNINAVRFGPYESDWPEQLTGWVAYSGGAEVGRAACTPRTPEAGSISYFMPGDLAVRLAD